MEFNASKDGIEVNTLYHKYYMFTDSRYCQFLYKYFEKSVVGKGGVDIQWNTHIKYINKETQINEVCYSSLLLRNCQMLFLIIYNG